MMRRWIFSTHHIPRHCPSFPPIATHQCIATSSSNLGHPAVAPSRQSTAVPISVVPPSPAQPEVDERFEIMVNHKRLMADPNWTVWEACRQAGTYVPVLCHHPRLKPAGRCKVCAVQVIDPNSGASACKLACSIKVKPHMRIITDSPLVKRKAENALKAAFAKMSHQVQAPMGLSKEVDCISQWESTALIDDSTPSIVRDMSKCVGCTRCVRACSDLQGMGILEPAADDPSHITTKNEESLRDTNCTLCGQCATFCPTGAIDERDDIQVVLNAMEQGKVVVLQTAPAPRVAVGEGFDEKPGTISTGRLVGAARTAGFKYVFDTNFAADLTIMEEAHEFLHRLEASTSTKPNGHGEAPSFPMFTSCCPAWVNLVEKKYPEFIPNLSSCRSPMMMLGPVIKTFWAKNMGVDPSQVFVVSLMPCVAKKDEIARTQMIQQRNGATQPTPDVDVVLTTREFVRLLQKKGIRDWKAVKEEEYDHPLGRSSGAGVLFGVTGGVMEAALRTAYELKTGQALPKIEFQACRGLQGVKEASVQVNGATLNIAIASGGKNVQKVMESIQSGEKQYHFVEMMFCPSGCIGGGGQPRSNDPDVLTKRMQSIYKLDAANVIRKSHENPAIKQLYQDFLEKPGGHKSHELLHTTYADRSRKLQTDKKPQREQQNGQQNGHAKKDAGVAGSGVLILYGSQGGLTASAARQMKDTIQNQKIKHGTKVRCMAMNEYPFASLPQEKTVIMMCSTYGEGDFPDNAQEFWQRLADPNLPSDFLKDVEFSICGLGSSAYAEFNAAAKNLDRRFEELGARRLLETALGDEKSTEKHMTAFDPWSKTLLVTLGGSEESVNEPKLPTYQLTLALGSKRHTKVKAPCPPGYHFVRLEAKQRITSPHNYARPVELFDISLSGSGMRYSAGGHLAILPRNPRKQVREFVEFAGLDGEKLVSIHTTNGERSEIPPVLTVSELFEQYIDLNAPVTRKFITELAMFAYDEDEFELKRLLAEPKSPMFQRFLQEHTFEDVLRMFPSALPPIENLISMVPIIKPRLYSIASSPSLHPSNAHLAIVLWEGLLPSGRKRTGLCTKYLFNLDPSSRPTLACQVHDGILVPPADCQTSVLFIGLGTGIASVRAFLQEREALLKEGKQLGKCHLWFGVRHRKHDALFQDLFQSYLKSGVLTGLHMAYSHDDPKVFETVPMIMDRDQAVVCDVLLDEGAYAYYCGPAMGIPKMCSDAMVRALTSPAGGMSEAQAQEHFKKMVDEKRWRVECF